MPFYRPSSPRPHPLVSSLAGLLSLLPGCVGSEGGEAPGPSLEARASVSSSGTPAAYSGDRALVCLETEDCVNSLRSATNLARGVDAQGLEGVEVASGATSATFEFDLEPEWLTSPSQLQLDADLVDLVTDGGFDASSGTLGSVGANYAAGAAGTWYFYRTAWQDASTVTPLSSQRKLSGGNTLYQIVPVLPGEDYTLSFKLDTSALYRPSNLRPATEDYVTLSVQYLDSRKRTLSFWDPRPNGSNGKAHGGAAATSVTFGRYKFGESLIPYRASSGSNGFTDTAVEKSVRLRVYDCTDQSMYEGGSVATSNSLSFNFCNATDGSAGTTTTNAPSYMVLKWTQTAAISSTNCSGAAAGSAAGLEAVPSGPSGAARFTHPGTGSAACYGAVLDDVHLEPNEQVVLEVLDAQGTVLATSNQARGFYLDPAIVGSTAARVRVTLKSYAGASPFVRNIRVSRGVDLSVTADAAPRIALQGRERRFSRTLASIGPAEQIYNTVFRSNTLDSVCSDVSTQSSRPCQDMLQAHGLDRLNAGTALPFNTQAMPIRWDVATSQYVVGWEGSDRDGDGVVSDEDNDCDGALDAGEDVNGNGVLDDEVPCVGQYWDSNGRLAVGGTAFFTNIGDRVHWYAAVTADGHTASAPLLEDTWGPMNLGYQSGLLINDVVTYDLICAPYQALGYTASNAAAQSCCFDVSAQTGAVTNASLSRSGRQCAAGLFADLSLPATDPQRTTMVGQSGVMKLYKKYLRYYVDVLDGRHDLRYIGNQGVSGRVLLPEIDTIATDYEMNDNHFTYPTGATPGCEVMSKWGPGWYGCRTRALCTQYGLGLCASVGETWDELAGEVSTRSGGRVALTGGTTQRPFTDQSFWIDTDWFLSLVEDAGSTSTDTYLTSLNLGGNASGIQQPERMFDEVEALQVGLYAARKGRPMTWSDVSGAEIPLHFLDVRENNSFDFDPGCARFQESTVCNDDSLWGYYTDDTLGSGSSPSLWSSVVDRTWSDADTARCSQGARSTKYDHFYRGWGVTAGQKQWIRLATTLLSLPTRTIEYQGEGFFSSQSRIYGLVYRHATDPQYYDDKSACEAVWGRDACTASTRVDGAGRVCGTTDSVAANALMFLRDPEASADAGDIYSQTAPTAGATFGPTQYGSNLNSMAHQVLFGELGDANPYRTVTEVESQAWEVRGERYHSVLFQRQDGTYVLALWWVPTYVYGDNWNYLAAAMTNTTERTGTSAYSTPFQLLSKFREEGYTERKLVSVKLPGFTSIASATVLPIDGSGASAAAGVEVDSNGALVLPEVAVGELPVLVELSGATR